jgi:4-diphosphocytidyl-2-C-methyl-D-erythritol kinase
MESITLYPPAKINLGLHIRGKRPDGYHELQTVMLPVASLTDTLTVEAAPTLEAPELQILGLPLPVADDNLCLRAWRLLREAEPSLPAVRISLQKRIPMGAGLGGGSADAAYTLRALTELFSLGIPTQKMHEMATALGADVPFFLQDAPMLATGIGEVLTAIEWPHHFRIQIDSPPIHSNTADAYRNLTREDFTSASDLLSLLQEPPSEWRAHVRNDFERSVFARFPELIARKQAMYDAGAIYASMTGSGSAIYGLFAGSTD